MVLLGYRIEFLMSERNQVGVGSSYLNGSFVYKCVYIVYLNFFIFLQDIFVDFDLMIDRLVNEINSFIELYGFILIRVR